MLKIHNLNPDGTLNDRATTRVLIRDDNGVPTGDFAVVELRTLEYFKKLTRQFREFERPEKGMPGNWTVNELAAKEALLYECLKAWSVVCADDSPAPITRDAIKALDPRVKQQLFTVIVGNELAANEEGPRPEESFRESA